MGTSGLIKSGALCISAPFSVAQCKIGSDTAEGRKRSRVNTWKLSPTTKLRCIHLHSVPTSSNPSFVRITLDRFIGRCCNRDRSSFALHSSLQTLFQRPRRFRSETSTRLLHCKSSSIQSKSPGVDQTQYSTPIHFHRGSLR